MIAKLTGAAWDIGRLAFVVTVVIGGIYWITNDPDTVYRIVSKALSLAADGIEAFLNWLGTKIPDSGTSAA